jgi:hypothetical protein
MCWQVLVEGKFWKRIGNAAKKVAQEVGTKVLPNVNLASLKG